MAYSVKYDLIIAYYFGWSLDSLDSKFSFKYVFMAQTYCSCIHTTAILA